MTNERGKWTSASNAEADSLCEGRHQAQKGITEEASPDAETGQRIHKALSTGIDDGLQTDEKSLSERCKQIEGGVVQKWLALSADAQDPQ